jgi:hypothetical protein
LPEKPHMPSSIRRHTKCEGREGKTAKLKSRICILFTLDSDAEIYNNFDNKCEDILTYDVKY